MVSTSPTTEDMSISRVTGSSKPNGENSTGESSLPVGHAAYSTVCDLFTCKKQRASGMREQACVCSETPRSALVPLARASSLASL